MRILMADLEKALNGESIPAENWTAYDAAMAEQDARRNREAWEKAKEWNLKQFCDADPTALPEGDLLWFRREDGSLVSHDDVSGLLALPEELRERSATAAVRTIEGKKYLVFRY